MVEIKDEYWMPPWALATRACSKCDARYLKIKTHCPKCKIKNMPQRGKTEYIISGGK